MSHRATCQGTRYSIDTSLLLHNLSLRSDSSRHDINMVMPHLTLWSGCTTSTATNVFADGKIQALRARIIFVGSATTLRSGFRFPAEGRIRPDRIWGPPSLLYNGYLGSSPGLRRPRRDVNHSPGIIPFPCYMPSMCEQRIHIYILMGGYLDRRTHKESPVMCHCCRVTISRDCTSLTSSLK